MRLRCDGAPTFEETVSMATTATVVYEAKSDDEYLDIDPVTNEPIVIQRGPRTDSYMILAVFVGCSVLAVIVILLIGLGYMDLAFGNTG
jgi:hypothetical protein